MTPLKPLADLTVRGFPHGPAQYPLPTICQHPDCTEPATSKHHCWPRSMLKGDFWYVEIDGVVIPQVVALCGSGTTGHHGAVESHDAWIKLEDEEFVWWYRNAAGPPGITDAEMWQKIGPLNPQPGSREGRPKRRKFTGEARRTRKTISIKVPADTEDGGAVWDETLERVKAKLVALELYDEGAEIPVYEATIAAWNDWLNG